jgi:4-hydroxy-2-oxoheptanedioate aldolase
MRPKLQGAHSRAAVILVPAVQEADPIPRASLRGRLLAGARLTGTFVQTPSPVVPELLGSLGIDFVCIDQEHSAIGVETLQALVAGAAVGGLPAVVRVPDAAGPYVAAALDAGAAGVIVPRVDSAAAAAGVVRAARYPPSGERGLGPGRAAGYGRAIPEALAHANDATLVGIQIETRAALAALDEIVAVDGVDLVFVGPGDLSASLGLEGGLRDPRLAELVGDVIARARSAGRAAGVFALDAEAARTWLDRDVQFVVVGSDLTFLADAVERTWTTLRA